MFTGRAGRPDTVDGGGEEATIDNWEGRLVSEAEAYEEEDLQEFQEEEAG